MKCLFFRRFESGMVNWFYGFRMRSRREEMEHSEKLSGMCFVDKAGEDGLCLHHA